MKLQVDEVAPSSVYELKLKLKYAFLGSHAGVVDINHAFHLYNKRCMWIEFQSIST